MDNSVSCGATTTTQRLLRTTRHPEKTVRVHIKHGVMGRGTTHNLLGRWHGGETRGEAARKQDGVNLNKNSEWAREM